MLATMQQFVDRTTDDKQIKYVIRKYIKFTLLGFSGGLVYVENWLVVVWCVENQCASRHVDIGATARCWAARAPLLAGGGGGGVLLLVAGVQCIGKIYFKYIFEVF